MTRADDDPPVIIIRSGYATDDLWLDAIAGAQKYKRRIIVVDGAGKMRELEPAPEA